MTAKQNLLYKMLQYLPRSPLTLSHTHTPTRSFTRLISKKASLEWSLAYPEVADVSNHVCEERVAGNVERYTKTLQ